MRNPRSPLAVLAILFLLSSLLSACAAPAATPAPAAPAATTAPAAPAATAPAAEQAAGKTLRVALILPGRADDVSWNQAGYDGMQRAIKDLSSSMKVELKVVEQVYDPVAIEPALRDYAQQGYDLVIGHGFQFQEPIIKVAQDFPKVNFGIGTGFKLAANVDVYDTKLEQGGYLMGIIAGSLAKGPVTGVVGGVDVSEIHRGHAAFAMGVKSVNPKLKVINNFVGDFNDLAKAKEAAVSLAKAGADVLWQSGDGIGLAVLGACKEQKLICMGNNTNQNAVAPDNTIASFVYDWAPVYKQMIQDTAAKKFGNQKLWVEFANHGVSVIYNDALKSKLSADTVAALDKAQKAFESNSLDLGDLDSVKLEQ